MLWLADSNKTIVSVLKWKIVIPGRRSAAEANPESSNHQLGLLDSGFFDPRPAAEALAPE